MSNRAKAGLVATGVGIIIAGLKFQHLFADGYDPNLQVQTADAAIQGLVDLTCNERNPGKVEGAVHLVVHAPDSGGPYGFEFETRSDTGTEDCTGAVDKIEGNPSDVLLQISDYANKLGPEDFDLDAVANGKKYQKQFEEEDQGVVYILP